MGRPSLVTALDRMPGKGKHDLKHACLVCLNQVPAMSERLDRMHIRGPHASSNGAQEVLGACIGPWR